MLTDHLPRFSLAHLPTPLEEMPLLARSLGASCPRLLVKRDDQTGLATGGNKTRKLEFLIADALATGADTVITEGGPQSNHCRQTAAAAVRAGLRCVLVASGEALPRQAWQGNLLLDDLLGAEVRFAGNRPRAEVVESVADELRAAGAHPYIIPTGGSVPLGAAGYVAAVEELAAQINERSERVDRIVLTAGSGGTHAGVLAGVRALGLDIVVEGMNNFAIPDIQSTVRQLASDTAALLHLDVTFEAVAEAADFVFYDALGAHGYGVITEAEREALQLLARTEALILDPVYTGRAFGQMVQRIREGAYDPNETIIFWLTGGVAGLFPRAAELL